MRLSLCLATLAALVNAGLYIPTTLQSVFDLKDLWNGQPKIPQVILDTNHAWLAANKKWLDRYPDVRTAICANDSDLWTKPTTPERAPPPDLLANLTIDNNKYGVNRFGWKNAVDRLTELKSCSAALEAVESLHVEIYVHDSKYDTWKESTFPPATLYPLFTDVLASMPHLGKLHWQVRQESSPGFAAAFARANVTLPSVLQLVVGGDDAWLVRRCPRLEHLTLEHDASHAALVYATEGLPLQSVSMATLGWPRVTWMELLGALLEAQPRIPRLEMDGELYDGAKWKDDPERFIQHLELLARFENLTSLTLPPAWQLGLGFDGGHWCGNAYWGADGRAYGRQVTRDSVAAVERAADMTVKMLPRLRQLGVGGMRGNVTVDGEGAVEVVWPWTGRLDEYTYEVWPEVENDFGYEEW
ncbi:hypothetical protein DPSP01_007469 [Paraphaeosphaeria sporulosa]|uniref:Uncharacterized protein n=1 Tax=Paraphaeosphaeria sporulosa TaxID=1460663 RepID=A0A177CY76_9PLEO|nr:uncharacterized protein CC84DRAFT_41948 [Paraphaeosphaeria sporulosa]OAG11659.1 hypothetical protein CC84DRAFT_41948 [Paraphaeosphaeria sporulosa]